MFYILLFIFGCTCILYYYAIHFFKGKVSCAIYLLYAGILICLYALIPWNHPIWLKFILRFSFLIFVLYFMYVESKIILGAHQKLPEVYDYIIVLGCGLFGDRLSLSLKQRLDESLLHNRQNVQYIVCGGQGKDEWISEASAMKKYLIQNGIADNDILMEDQSTSTYENLLFASRLYPIKEANVLIVTNGFHVYRSVLMAKKMGLHAYGVGAKEAILTCPLFYTREFFAYIKFKIKKASSLK